jgi:hypothetical protein
MSCEADSLVHRNGATVVTTVGQIEDRLRLYLDNDNAREAAANASSQMVELGMGATERIVERIIPYISSLKEPA